MSRRPEARHAHSKSAHTTAIIDQLALAYQDLVSELHSSELRTVGNYTLGRVIGEGASRSTNATTLIRTGAFGKVRLAVHRLTGARCAVKQIPRSLAPPLLTREIHHHRRLHHDHVVRLYEVIATESSIWLVSELCPGGELYDYLVEKGHLEEHECKRVFGQLVLAVGYIHRLGLVHRDLKLENVLLDGRCNVKLADFGFGREFERGKVLESFCGTTGYAAPEMLAGRKYTGEEIDVWSLGIILYTLLAGSLPFDDDDESVMREKILKGEFDIPLWISDDAASLINGILVTEPRDRLTIAQIVAHPWYTRVASSEPEQWRDSSVTAIPRAPSSLREASHGSEDGHGAVPPAISEGTESVGSTASLNSTPVTSEDDIAALTAPKRSRSPRSPRSSSPPIDGMPSTSSPPALSFTHRNVSDVTLKRAETPLRLATTRAAALATHSETPASPPPPSLESWSFRGANGAPVAPSSPLPYMMTRTDSSSSAGLIHLRTPSRTKRRSVSSIVSERQAPSGMPALPDFAALLNAPPTEPLAEPLGKSILASLTALGFDAGQMAHSIRTNACDPASAVWWMLRQTALQREAERIEATPAVDDGRFPPVSPSLPVLREAKSFGDEIEAQAALSQPAPVKLAPPITPAYSPVASTSKLPRTPPQADISTSSSSPSSEDVKTRRPDKPRSSSVSMLQRATSALGVSKRSEDGEDGPSGRTTPLSGLFGRRPTLTERNSRDKLRDVSGEYFPPSSSTNASPGSSRSRQQSNDTIPRPSSPRSRSEATLLESGQPVASTSAGDSDEAILSSPGSTTGKSSGSKRSRNSLFSSFRLWFNDDKRKRRGSSIIGPPPGVPAAQRSSYILATRPGQPPLQPSPLRRPPMNRRPSSTTAGGSGMHSRRSSSHSHSASRGQADFSPVIHTHVRRRSDSSRRSGHSRTGSVSDTPSRDTAKSHRDLSGGGMPTDARRRSHVKSGSLSSTGSRRSTVVGGSPIAYRRPPTSTHVRRHQAPSLGRRHSYGSTSGASPPPSPGFIDHGSRRSSIIDHGPAAELDGLGVANSSTILEEDGDEEAVEAERQIALEKLSGAATAAAPAPRRSSATFRGPTSPPTIFTAHKSTNLFGSPSSWSRVASASHGRPKLRDVFARRSAPDDAGDEWVDEADDGLDGFACGFGQGRAASPVNAGGGGMTSSSSEATLRPSSAPLSPPSLLLGEGRYAGVGVEAKPGGPASWRAQAGRSVGPSFKAGAVLEEDEEEE